MRRLAPWRLGAYSNRPSGRRQTGSGVPPGGEPVTVAYALAALVCYGIGDVIYKRAARAGLAADYFLMGQAWLFCPSIIVYAWLTGTLRVTGSAVWGGVAGVVILIGFYCYVRSLRSGALSVIAPVFRLNFIVTAALAIGWLHEPLTVAKSAGFLFAGAAAWLLLGGPPQPDRPDPAARRGALAEVLVATVATGAANFCYKLGLIGGATPETILAAQALVFSAGATTMAYAAHRRLRPPRGFLIHSGPAAAVLLAAFLFLLHGLAHGQASVVVPIAQMGFVVAAVAGILIYNEAWTARKATGLGASLITLLLLAVG
jgi:drug/metabolite transporter (DMT)-like permease